MIEVAIGDCQSLCRVEGWQVKLWTLKLRHLASTNQQLMQAHACAADRALALEDELSALKAADERGVARREQAKLPATQQHQCAAALHGCSARAHLGESV